MQQRSASKDKNANMWDISVAGHISTGQDSLSAAAREINEEVSINLGYNVDVKDFRFMFSFRKQQIVSDTFIENQFYDFFILRKPGIEISRIKFQESEVQQIKFVEISELLNMVKNNQVVERKEVYSTLANYLFRM
ncbi:MAG: NUDIX domain-containing protein [Oscillospiraceae bacterium]|nr:NUDIX domain-containing protein [Oscillospiraceae bacterium]